MKQQPSISVSNNNLVWNLALLNLANQNFHIKYGFDSDIPNIKGLCLLVSHKTIFIFFPYESMKNKTSSAGSFLTPEL